MLLIKLLMKSEGRAAFTDRGQSLVLVMSSSHVYFEFNRKQDISLLPIEAFIFPVKLFYRRHKVQP